jgi:hypothetical protein|tara:strand:- start:25800 stop:26471 length:672 start_codon:yes stop_codon:yes gene_type:complete
MVLKNYSNLIQEFIRSGYRDIFFNELSSSNNQLIIRHDIDFNCEFAFKMAKIEKEIGVKSSYFFMVNNPIYNIFSEKNKKYIQEISKMGHQISIHYDCDSGDLEKEINLFQSFFDIKIRIISIHRPNLEYLGNIKYEHTYLKKYFKQIKYISDSRGEFRFGHPFETEEFKKLKSIQLLIHPVWWVSDKNTVIETIKDMIKKNNQLNKLFFKENSIPYQKYLKS